MGNNDVIATCPNKTSLPLTHLDKPGKQEIELVGRNKMAAFPVWFKARVNSSLELFVKAYLINEGTDLWAVATKKI